MAKNELVVGHSQFDDEYYILPELQKAWTEFKFRFLELPYVVSSVWRSEKVNEAAGGSPTSYHLFGSAIDFSPAVADLYRIEEAIKAGNRAFISWLMQYHVTEFIIYKDGHIHFAVDSESDLKTLKIQTGENLMNQADFRMMLRNFEVENNASVNLVKVALGVGFVYIVFKLFYNSKKF